MITEHPKDGKEMPKAKNKINNSRNKINQIKMINTIFKNNSDRKKSNHKYKVNKLRRKN